MQWNTSTVLTFGSCSLVSTRISRQNNQQQINNLEVSSQWILCSEITSKQLATDFESVAKFWLQEKSKSCLNVLTMDVFWSIWKFRNDMCFQGRKRIGMQELMKLAADRKGLGAVAKYRRKNGAGRLGGENGARTGKAAITTVGVGSAGAKRCRTA
jgi:hypothetical protein